MAPRKRTPSATVPAGAMRNKYKQVANVPASDSEELDKHAARPARLGRSKGSVMPSASPSSSLQSQDLLDLLRWNIERCDNLRNAVASRSAAVLSANALILGALAVFSTQVFGRSGSLSVADKAVTGASVCLTLLCVAVSVLEGIASLINPYAWRARVNEFETSPSPIFNHSDTVRSFASSRDFRSFVLELDRDRLVDFAINELWVVIRSHHSRYARLLKSTRAFLAALLALILTTVLSVSFLIIS